MNVNIPNILIAAFSIIYLSLETSAAAIGGETSAAAIGGETSAAAIGGPFQCGNLECPNGSFCEIKQTPTDDAKSVRITAQCRDAEGTILAEETTTEEVPEGKIPFTSIKRKTVNGDASGGYFGGSYASKSIARAGLGGDGITTVNFGDELGPEFDFDFDKIFDKQREALKETSGFFERIFGKWDW